MKQKFKGKLMAKGPGGAWTFLPIPLKVSQAFGSKSRIPVAGTMNDFPFRNSLMPEGDGTHSMMVSKELQAGSNAHAGDTVSITLELDTEERNIEAPPELEKALLANKSAASLFSTMTYSQKKEYVDWITSAKQEATKASRVAKAIEFLAAGKKRLR